MAMRRLPCRSLQTRSTDCCAMVPLGNITAAGLPSNAATWFSNAATGPPSP
jgi:hypothetical protein